MQSRRSNRGQGIGGDFTRRSGFGNGNQAPSTERFMRLHRVARGVGPRSNSLRRSTPLAQSL
ncbi:hypothetical protein WS71_00885 [Burkholderia mayonis]|uniref:Uncharacterized protein n=1 Tax=Burkholderia mayonis TaxID=1385591 RepID=A0A1B4FQV5_9BURK|nr:hypothetical protein WS71_00885 [Burkholderia mayonis]